MPPWDTTNPSTSVLQLNKSQTLSGSQSNKKSQIKLQRSIGNHSGGNNKKVATTTFKIRPSSVPIYGNNSSSNICSVSREFKKKPKSLIESTSSSCMVSGKSTSFYIPSKKVKISNRNSSIFKGTIMKSSQQLLSLPPPLPQSSQSQTLCSSSSSCSFIQQNKINKTMEINSNCLNCDVNNQQKSCQTDNSLHCCLPSSSTSSTSSTSPTSSSSSSSSCPFEIQNSNNACKSSVIELNTITTNTILPSIHTTAIATTACTTYCSYSIDNNNLQVTATTAANAITSLRKGNKTEPSSSSSSEKLFNNMIDDDNKTIKKTKTATASINKMSKSSFSSSGSRKKRLIRHESIIIKRKKNKLKSKIH